MKNELEKNLYNKKMETMNKWQSEEKNQVSLGYTYINIQPVPRREHNVIQWKDQSIG
jgi:hypothetical protein